MSLIDVMMTDCHMMDKLSKPDGLGGFTTGWTEGAPFKASITKTNTTEAKIAEKQGVTELYTVTVQKGLPLEYHDVFKRDSDGLTFRVTSNINDSETPKTASFQIGQVSAERWDIK